jgi:hypothetical protein
MVVNLIDQEDTKGYPVAVAAFETVVVVAFVAVTRPVVVVVDVDVVAEAISVAGPVVKVVVSL